MPDSMSITAATVDPGLLDLPWDLPLEDWPDDVIVALPKGISRHLVRFVHLSGYVAAVKETGEEVARAEYEMLRTLQRMDVPCVDPVAVITNRVSEDGEPLHPVLVTRHLRFSLPYRALYSQTLRPETATRLVDALALLLVRLHVIGFYWGDVSLSNTLFRRDAGSFAAYLVDAETGKLYPGGLSNGQRENDLEVAAREHRRGAPRPRGGRAARRERRPRRRVEPDRGAVPDALEGTDGTEQFDIKERWRINDRVERLNALGFDIEELSIHTTEGGSQVRIQPKVVDAGHHQRRLLRLTGLDAGENQARRLLNDLDAYRARNGRDQLDEEMVAHEWVSRVFEPVIRSIPRDLRGRLEPAEVFHELLEHRWFMSQQEERSVSLPEATTAYINDVLRHRRDERLLINPPTSSMTLPIPVVDEDEDESDDVEDWRASV